MPRIGFAGNVILHEPTIGAIEWWNDFGKDAAWTSEGRMMTYFYMLAHARSLDYLMALQTPKDIRKAVKQWEKTIDATQAELWRALMWVKYGAEEVKLEIQKKIDDSLQSQETMDMLWYDVILAAGVAGVLPNELRTHTRSEVDGMLLQALKYARVPLKQSVAKDYIAYRQILREIEERGTNG